MGFYMPLLLLFSISYHHLSGTWHWFAWCHLILSIFPWMHLPGLTTHLCKTANSWCVDCNRKGLEQIFYSPHGCFALCIVCLRFLHKYVYTIHMHDTKRYKDSFSNSGIKPWDARSFNDRLALDRKSREFRRKIRCQDG